MRPSSWRSVAAAPGSGVPEPARSVPYLTSSAVAALARVLGRVVARIVPKPVGGFFCGPQHEYAHPGFSRPYSCCATLFGEGLSRPFLEGVATSAATYPLDSHADWRRRPWRSWCSRSVWRVRASSRPPQKHRDGRRELRRDSGGAPRAAPQGSGPGDRNGHGRDRRAAHRRDWLRLPWHRRVRRAVIAPWTQGRLDGSWYGSARGGTC